MKQTITAIVVLTLAMPFLIWLAFNPTISPTVSLVAISGVITASVFVYTYIEEKK